MIYVDALKPYNGKLYCHMMTDGDIVDLHAFAKQINLNICWFHKSSRHQHYDLNSKMRVLAVAAGAKEVSSREIITILDKE